MDYFEPWDLSPISNTDMSALALRKRLIGELEIAYSAGNAAGLADLERAITAAEQFDYDGSPESLNLQYYLRDLMRRCGNSAHDRNTQAVGGLNSIGGCNDSHSADNITNALELCDEWHGFAYRLGKLLEAQIRKTIVEATPVGAV